MKVGRVLAFILENYEILIISTIAIVGALYYFRDKFVIEEQKNDEP